MYETYNLESIMCDIFTTCLTEFELNRTIQEPTLHSLSRSFEQLVGSDTLRFHGQHFIVPIIFQFSKRLLGLAYIMFISRTPNNYIQKWKRSICVEIIWYYSDVNVMKNA